MINPTLSDIQRRVYDLLNKFQDLRASEILDDDGYFKQIVILAYELGKEDLVDDAITMLLKVDPNYFGMRQRRQAEDDPMYKLAMVNLAGIIQEHRMLNVNVVVPNVPPGIA